MNGVHKYMEKNNKKKEKKNSANNNRVQGSKRKIKKIEKKARARERDE